MRTINFFKLAAITLLMAGTVSCESKGNDFTSDTIIEKEIDGIAFKFCLLNEQGQPATVFNEGENFSFYFSVTNRRDEKVFFEPKFVWSNDDSFCRVFNSNNQDFGKPYKSGGVNLIGIGGFTLDKSETCEFQQRWSDERDNWQWRHTHFESNHKELLKNGFYYTGFDHNFEFIQSDGNTKFYTGTLNFKINFKIQ